MPPIDLSQVSAREVAEMLRRYSEMVAGQIPLLNFTRMDELAALARAESDRASARSRALYGSAKGSWGDRAAKEAPGNPRGR